MNKFLLSLLLLATSIAGTSAQTRGTAYEGSRRHPVALERRAAADSHVRNFAPTYSRALRTPAKPYDVTSLSASVRRYTQTPPMRVLGDGTTIYGSIIYADNWLHTGAAYGLYTFQADVTPNVTIKVPMSSYEANGGGCYAEGKYYYNSYVYTDEMGYTFSTFITLDPETGAVDKKTQGFLSDGFDQSQITHDMTYDATTGTIYAISYILQDLDDEGLFQRYVPAISTVDTYTGFVTPVAASEGFIALACNNAGELYGITKGATSALYRVNKTTGESTFIGRTGLNPEYVQSATFDPVTDKLYWAETEITGTSALYQVNVSTGKAELICAFPNNEEFTGIYIPAPAVPDAAPAAVENQGVAFEGAALSGKLTFTVPTKTKVGAALSGALVAEVSVDGADFATVDVTAGQTVALDITVAEGVHGYSVYVSNAAGDGLRTGYSWYAGIDGPAAVGGLTLTGNLLDQPMIYWTAPTEGRNGGYIDPDKLTYSVVRQPEGKLIADGIRTTTYTDTDAFDAAQIYYTVTAYCDGREGVAASTAEGLYGSGSLLPVTYSFDTQEEFDLCTVIDNGDADPQYHWGYWLYAPTYTYTATEGECIAYVQHPTSDADDWIFMPPFTSQAGKKYKVTFTLWTKGDKENLSVTAGPSATVAAQTVIMPTATYNHKDKIQYTQEFTAATSGNYYVGFHCTSPKKRFYFFIDDVTIDEVPDTGAPAQVGDLKVTPHPTGELEATISFTAPTLNTGGTALSAISSIDIFRGNDKTAIYSFDNPAKGASLSWTDREAAQGFNTYRVVANNASGAGAKSMATAYVGYDVPQAVTELTLTEEHGHPMLRWVAPEEGQNGGYHNADELVYRIIRSDNVLISANYKNTAIVDLSLDGSEHQHFIYYQVQAVSKAGIGDYALSNHLVYGEPYAGDFFESFDDAALSTDPWTLFTIKGQKQLWSIMSQGYSPTCYDADYSGGLACFESTSGYMNDEGRLVSPKLRIDDMNVPVFSFAFYHAPDAGTISGDDRYTDRMVPEVCLPDGRYVPLDDPLFVDEPLYDEGWYLYVYDLSEYKQYGWVQLSFHGYAGYANDVYVDYISLEDNSEYDLAAYSFTGPETIKPGSAAKYTFKFFNQGMKPAENFKVTLLRNGSEFYSRPFDGALESGASASITFTVPATLAEEGNAYTYVANIEYAADQIPSNNRSQAITTKVLAPDVPEVRSLTASQQGESDVVLSWDEPDALHVTDDFEGYASFEMAEIGDYTLVDGDKGPVYTFNDIDFPGSGDPCAFMVFDPWSLYIAQVLPEWAAHSGKKVLAAFSAHDGNGTAVQSDDWIITPELHGGAFSFWAKTANWEWGLETFEVMYSTTTPDPASFRSLSGALEAPADWTEFTYVLPEGTKYAALHYTGNDRFIFYADDMSYTAKCTLDGASLTGLRLFRDGRAIADLDPAVRTYTDTGVDKGAHTYAIATLYGTRQGKQVAVTLNIGESGIDDAAAPALSVRGESGFIAIDGADGIRVTVASMGGATIFEADNAAAYRIPAAEGVYVVRAAGKSYKVIVK